MIMTIEQGDRYLGEILNTIQDTLGVKSRDYVRNDDKMHNFNVGAIKTGETRERVMRKFRLKHDISVDDILDDLDKGIVPSREKVMEKYGDIINYNILELMSMLHRIELKNGKS